MHGRGGLVLKNREHPDDGVPREAPSHVPEDAQGLASCVAGRPNVPPAAAVDGAAP